MNSFKNTRSSGTQTVRRRIHRSTKLPYIAMMFWFEQAKNLRRKPGRAGSGLRRVVLAEGHEHCPKQM